MFASRNKIKITRNVTLKTKKSLVNSNNLELTKHKNLENNSKFKCTLIKLYY